MPKLNADNYVSLWGYISGNCVNPVMHYVTSINPPSFNASLLAGSLRPLADVVKDVRDTFKPYKSWFHFRRDITDSLFGLFYGVGNIVKGIANVAGSILFFIYFLGRNSLIKDYRANFKEQMQLSSKRCLSWFLEGLSCLIKGVTQFASPLKLLRIPLRSMITWYSGSPHYHESPSVQSAATQGLAAAQSLNPADRQMRIIYKCAMEVNRKYAKAQARGRDVSITPAVFSDKESIEQSLTVTTRENILGAKAVILQPGHGDRIFENRTYYKKSLSQQEAQAYIKGFTALLRQ